MSFRQLVELPTEAELKDALTKFGPKVYAYDLQLEKWDNEDIEVVATKLEKWLRGEIV